MLKLISIALAYPSMIAMVILIALLVQSARQPLGMLFAELDSMARDRVIELNNGTAK